MPKQSKKYDQLDDAPNLDNYGDHPIQTFGLNLLKNMGFTQQRGIGFNKQNALLEPLVLKPRPKGLGLGAKPQNETQQKIIFKKRDYILINCQPHKGMIGIVKRSKLQQQIVTIELQISGTSLKLKFTQIQKLSHQQYIELKRKLESSIKEKKQQQKQRKHHRLKWILPNIVCKVISKTSPYYLKKLIITELISQREFQAIHFMENGERKYIREFREKDLQTVVPKVGGTGLILNSKWKGKKAKVLQRDKSTGNVLVQLDETLSVEKVDQNLISEYVQL